MIIERRIILRDDNDSILAEGDRVLVITEKATALGCIDKIDEEGFIIEYPDLLVRDGKDYSNKEDKVFVTYDKVQHLLYIS